MLSDWIFRLRSLVRRDLVDRELDEELSAHLVHETDSLMHQGLTRTQAMRQARLALGGLDQAKEGCRDARGTRWIADLAQDLRFGMRLLARGRSFTLVAALVLALGIGVNGVFLTLVEMICLRGLPIDRPGRVLYLETRDASGRRQGLLHREFEEIRSEARSLAEVAAFALAPVAIADEARAPERFSGTYISANAFRLVGEAPIAGRDFSAEDDRPGAPPVVILADSVWQSRYGGDPSTVGRTIRVNGMPATVIGVMRDGFRFPTNSDVWQPLAASLQPAGQQPPDDRTLEVFGRLADGATLADARGEVAAIATDLARHDPGVTSTVRLTAVPINDRYNSDLTHPTWLAFITAGVLVLLIACANVANLLLMRSLERSREIAIRAALGATRLRLVRQMLAESLVLAALGGVLGLGLALAGLHVVASIHPPGALPYWMDFSINERVLAVLSTVCVGTVFVFGLLPALRLARAGERLAALGARAAVGSLDPRGRRWMTAFQTAQVALTLVLLVMLIDGVRMLRAAQRADPAIDMSGLLTMSVALPSQAYPTPTERARFYEQLEARIASVAPASSIASAVPFGGAFARQLTIEGREPAAGTPPPTVSTLAISPRYFQTLGVPVVRGRAFDDRDGTRGYEHAIVNQQFVDLYFPDADPIGRRIRLAAGGSPSESTWLTIVGLSRTIRQRQARPEPIVYTPYRAEPPAQAALLIRSGSDISALSARVREEVRRLDPDLPLHAVATLEQAAAQFYWLGRMSNLLATVLVTIAVGLCAVGLYAVTAHAAVQRRQEIGVRTTLGASHRHVLSLVIGRTARPLGLGLALGLAGTLAWTRLFVPSANGYSLDDALNAFAAAAVLVLVSLAACLAPARRATRVDPALALRSD